MELFLIYAPRSADFKTAFDAWILSVAPTTVHEIIMGNVKGEWVVRFTT